MPDPQSLACLISVAARSCLAGNSSHLGAGTPCPSLSFADFESDHFDADGSRDKPRPVERINRGRKGTGVRGWRKSLEDRGTAD